MGIKQLLGKSGELLFAIVMRCHEKRSTIMTSNRPIEEWGKLIGDVPAVTGIPFAHTFLSLFYLHIFFSWQSGI